MILINAVDVHCVLVMTEAIVPQSFIFVHGVQAAKIDAAGELCNITVANDTQMDPGGATGGDAFFWV